MECIRDSFHPGLLLDGRFETKFPLNHGSFGMVFVARDNTNGQDVAIKCLTKKSAVADGDSSFAIDERSEERECHAKLGSHPNIVNMIHSFETDSHIYLVLEFCSNGDLYEAIRRGMGPLETEHVRDFMLQLVDAVSYLHSKGLYHRDIKPENIFLTASGKMKLGDLGLATSEAWSYETTVGSDRYMAPEQYDSAGAGYAPEKADIWAIGICLLNIIFGRNPFTTPTESDPLFLDFSRDRQSLFDVFPDMSQDTFEVISQCLSLDPRKRSLWAVKAALKRAVSFTIFDETLDDFNNLERKTIVEANREPLRTPSITSPPVDNGSFPWAKALQASPPQQFRQLSVIPDDEDYQSEDLFVESSTKDWFSVGQQTPSMASILNSSLGASMGSLAHRRTKMVSKAALTPISGSLPITMTKPRLLPSLSSVFGKKDAVSKSWSDLWDEDVEEEEEQSKKQLKARQMLNSRTYSHDSQADEDVTIRNPTAETSEDSASFVHIQEDNAALAKETAQDIDEDLVADGFFFHDVPKTESPQLSPRYSPPPKRNSVDKWSALGERRRAYTGTSEAEKSPEVFKARRSVGLGFTGLGAGWDIHKGSTPVKDTGVKAALSPPHHNTHFQHFPQQPFKSQGCPWTKSKDTKPRDRHLSHGKEPRRQVDLGDLEWVGGWNDLHL